MEKLKTRKTLTVVATLVLSIAAILSFLLYATLYSWG